MQTKQAIQTQANVIRITSVVVGDTYKRFDEGGYGSDNVFYGIVKGVYNDGEKTIIEAVEYKASYSSIDVSIKVIKGMDDVVIFPVDPSELDALFEKGRANVKSKIEDNEKSLAQNQRLLEEIDAMIDGSALEELKAMSYAELSQDEYNRRIKELAI